MRLFSPKESKLREQASIDVLKEQEARAAKALAEKIRLNNQLDAEHAKKAEERGKELAELDFKIRNSTLTLQKNVELLEERRRQALSPITKEIEELEEKKREIKALITTLEEKELALTKQRQVVREEQSKVGFMLAELANVQQTTEALIQRQRAEEESLRISSDATKTSLAEAWERHNEFIASLEEKEASTKRAEMLASAAIKNADRKIAQEQREQEKTREQRRMLAIAIKEMKKRGVWQKTQKGTQTK